MRTLKKSLALVLVLVMMFSFAAIGANASNLDKFTDADKVTEDYTEAMDLFVGLGVVNGTTATTLDPQGSYTRAQSTRLAAAVALGVNVANKLSCSAAPFADVAVDHWAAGTVAYCVNEGIVAGVGDGKFDPDAALSGYAWAKELLVVLGKDGKDYTGEQWAINVAKDAFTMGIFENVTSAATNNAITREQAVQMAFNALNYSAKGTAEKIYGITGWSETNLPVYGWIEVPGTATDSLAATVFGVSSTKAVADNGLDGHVWKVKNKAVSALYADDELVSTSVAGTTYAAAVKAAGITSSAATDDTIFSLYVNGEKEATGGNLKSYITDTTRIPAGAKVEVYKDSNAADTVDYKVMFTIEYLAVVTNVTNATKTEIATGVNESGKWATFTVYPNGSTFTVKVDSADYTRGEYYVVTPYHNNTSDAANYGDFLAISAAESVEGRITSASATKVTVAGSAYSAGYVAWNLDTPAIAALNTLVPANSYTFYLDSTGGIIGFTISSAAVSTNYAYVVAATTSKDAWNVETYLARVLYMDGTFAEVKTTASATDFVGELVNYTDGTGVNAGKVVLSQTFVAGIASNDSISSGAITTGKSNILSSYYANSQTVFVVYNSSKNSATVYTGIANAPAYSAVSDGNILYATTGNIAKYVVIVAGTTGTTTAKEQIYILGAPTTFYKADGSVDYYEYAAIVNGVIGTIKADANSYVAGSLYTTAVYTNGVAALSETASTTFTGGTKAAANEVVGIGNVMFSYGASCPVYFVATDGTATVGTVADITTDADDTGVYVLNTTGTALAAIYVKAVD